jgi:hypothetical protein
MVRSLARFWLVAALLPGCAGSSPPPAPPAAMVLSPDAGECADRERAQQVCERAAQERCDLQASDCEASCRPGLPGSSEKGPMLRGDMEAESCGARCRQGVEPCRQALVARCSAPCVP